MPGGQESKSLKKAVRKFFWIFFKIPLANRLKVVYLHLELPSDQENKKGLHN